MWVGNQALKFQTHYTIYTNVDELPMQHCSYVRNVNKRCITADRIISSLIVTCKTQVPR